MILCIRTPDRTQRKRRWGHVVGQHWARSCTVTRDHLWSTSRALKTQARLHHAIVRICAGYGRRPSSVGPLNTTMALLRARAAIYLPVVMTATSPNCTKLRHEEVAMERDLDCPLNIKVRAENAESISRKSKRSLGFRVVGPPGRM